MDPLADLLHGVRAQGAQFCQSILSPPWSLRFESSASLELHTMLHEDAWIIPDDGPALRLRPGDIAVVRGPGRYVIADEPSTPPGLLVRDDRCFSIADGSDVCEALALGPRTFGSSADGSATLVSGTYQLPDSLGERLLCALPPVLVVPAVDDSCLELLELVTAELVRETPGQQIALDRMLDVLLVFTLRDWFTRPEADAPSWYQALADPVVGGALRAMHNAPSAPWTVRSLAAHVGVSRAGLARRFTELVGEPPLTYLTCWRMDLAAELLRRPGATVTSVAAQVGYADGFAFSSAFKRVRGISPRDHRRRAQAVPASPGAQASLAVPTGSLPTIPSPAH
ncbi:AraC family transcriptional regulator [Saccharopolyspora erythraea]|uniref:AraC family transcriptional regulator n=1 Tax=Saccharopolyspora erythraea TaxID=1836 RepID=UPI001BAE1951|nr:AraC family transcriptional regulator [Saccharopolyspora erythraea]QUH00019.1 AraC family transcriptional regulator [Saccharopolyspora erythraea]